MRGLLGPRGSGLGSSFLFCFVSFCSVWWCVDEYFCLGEKEGMRLRILNTE